MLIQICIFYIYVLNCCEYNVYAFCRDHVQDPFGVDESQDFKIVVVELASTNIFQLIRISNLQIVQIEPIPINQRDNSIGDSVSTSGFRTAIIIQHPIIIKTLFSQRLLRLAEYVRIRLARYSLLAIQVQIQYAKSILIPEEIQNCKNQLIVCLQPPKSYFDQKTHQPPSNQQPAKIIKSTEDKQTNLGLTNSKTSIKLTENKVVTNNIQEHLNSINMKKNPNLRFYDASNDKSISSIPMEDSQNKFKQQAMEPVRRTFTDTQMINPKIVSKQSKLIDQLNLSVSQYSYLQEQEPVKVESPIKISRVSRMERQEVTNSKGIKQVRYVMKEEESQAASNLVEKLEVYVQMGTKVYSRLEKYYLELYDDDTLQIVSMYGRVFEKHVLIKIKSLQSDYYELIFGKDSTIKTRIVKFKNPEKGHFMKYLQ